MFRTSPIVALLLSLAALAPAKDCGELPTGQNPTVEELAAEIARQSASFGIPTEIIKGVAWQESGCQQWRPDGTLVYNTTDCGLGMMQLTGATAEQFDVPRLKKDWRYNLEAGVTVLEQKWKMAQRQGQVPADPEAKRVLENWYYPLAYYQGRRDESYLSKVFGHLKSRPGRLQQLLARSIDVTLASAAIPGFKWGDKFRAWPEDRFEDQAGKPIKAPTHLGTVGDPATLAALDAGLSKGKKAAEKGQTKQAVKHLGTVVNAGFDTHHKAEAEKLLKALVEGGEARLAEAERLAAGGEKEKASKLAREVQRDFETHPLAERAKQLLAAWKKQSK